MKKRRGRMEELEEKHAVSNLNNELKRQIKNLKEKIWYETNDLRGKLEKVQKT